MRQDYTHIAVVLDSSGSMDSILNDTIGGFNTFLKAQKNAPGEATFTLVEFEARTARSIFFSAAAAVEDGTNIPLNVKYDFTPINAVPELTTSNYRPSGGTPLLDTIAGTIIRTGKALAAMPASLRPGKVLFVIITDGEENASRIYNHQRVMEMIQHQSIVYNWEFIYLGANQDAIAVGATFGIGATRSMSYGVSGEAIGSTYNMLATKTMAFRGLVNVEDAKASLDFTEEERKLAEDKK